ncbi:putative protin [Perkinsela sp. CCAP 1560/4]|nr:putative protin [Perkinsela sp. CCAP 1560/4]|eukprot:KNH06078.1 putative protin [Perkinsela sp. CCAP 1560/4]
MVKQTKSLKKYAKSHLSDTIAKRRELRGVVTEMKRRKEHKKERSKEKSHTEDTNHMEQVRALEEEDKEFFEYLKAEDPELLKFDELDESGEEKDDAGEVDEAGLNSEEINDVLQDAFHMGLNSGDGTEASLAAKKPSKKSLKRVLTLQKKLFHAMASSDFADSHSLHVNASELILQLLPLAFTRSSNDSKQSNEVASADGELERRFLGNVKILAKMFLDPSQPRQAENSLLPPLFKSVMSVRKYLLQCSVTVKCFLKLAILCMCEADQPKEVRLAASNFFLKVLPSQDSGKKDKIFKHIFAALVKNVITYEQHPSEHVNAVIEDILNIIGKDVALAYQTIFVYLKKLSGMIRSALLRTENPELKASIKSWDFLAALRVISRILTHCPRENQLGSLIYPFSQICLGTLDVLNSAECIPFQFKVFDILQQITDGTKAHLPMTPYFLRVLRYSAFQSGAKHDKSAIAEREDSARLLRALSLDHRDMKLLHVQKVVVETLLQHICQHTSRFAYSISFPEIFSTLHQELRKFSKQTQCAGHAMAITNYIKLVKSTEEIVRDRRKASDLGPHEQLKVQMWETKFRDEVASLPILEYIL